ncbi:hypothetical protein VTI74DRAFT_3352 [Chaetomium olivicolor]
MARKRNKGARARNADCDATSQPKEDQNPRFWPRPKPVVTDASNKKHRQQAKHKRAWTASPSGPEPETPGNKKVAHDSTHRTNQNKHRLVMGRGPDKRNERNKRNKMNKANQAAINTWVSQLELPEGVTRPNQQPKNDNQNKRHRNRAKKHANTETMASSAEWVPALAEMAATPVPSIAGSTESGIVLPWELDKNLEYPTPFRADCCTYNYDRLWHSFKGADVKEELLKLLKKGHGAQLTRLFPDSTSEDLREAEKKYSKLGLTGLYNYRLAQRNAPISSKLYISSAMANPTMYQMHRNNQYNVLVKLLRIPELRKPILDLLLPSIGDLTALAATCKELAFFVRQNLELWDFTLGDFPTAKFEESRDENGRLLQSGGIRTDILVITPISDEPAEKPYKAEFEKMLLLCDSIIKIPQSFKNIVLDQIPFFDVRMFEMMVNTMPHLETVTITRCLLLDVTKLPALLGVIKRHGRSLTSSNTTYREPSMFERETSKEAETVAENKKEDHKGPEKYIRLDFFPYFFRGPNTAKRMGSYGVTYNEPTFSTPKAVFSLIMRCWDLAKEVGMDLLSDSSSFWSFVRQLPGPDILWAVKARDALIAREHDLTVGKSTESIHRRFVDDLMAAVSGDNHKPHYPSTHMRMRLPRIRGLDSKFFWRTDHQCTTCHTVQPLSLFPLARDECWSCKMEMYHRDMEDSHLRLWQSAALGKWLGGLNPSEATIRELIANGDRTMPSTLREVRQADWARDYFLNHYVPDTSDQAYCPPPPPGLDWWVASMYRWRWKRTPATGRFDYRHGGPQRGDPCKIPLLASDYDSPTVGAESEANFSRRWQWTLTSALAYAERFVRFTCDRALVQEQVRIARNSPQEREKARRAEWILQNKQDREAHRARQTDVEDCLRSLFIPGKTPFNLDKPLPDPGLHFDAYKAMVKQSMWSATPYRHVSAVNTGFM